MTTVTRPRGPLPPRVYWTRRLLVLGVALALVFGFAHFLGGSGGAGGTPSARQVGADQSSPASGPTLRAGAKNGTSKRVKKRHNQQGAKVKIPLAVPTGPCVDSDVEVTPSVDGKAYAGSDVTITLNLTTLTSLACTWEVSPQSVVLKLNSGSDRIWSTQDCPGAIERQSVVVRKGRTTKAYATWNGQRSDGECSRTTLWAQPGYYHAEAAALGSEPADEQFRLLIPTRPTITPSPTPDPKNKKANR